VTAVAPVDLRARTVRSLGWQLLGTGGQRALQLGQFAVLARLFADRKDDLGLLGVVLAVIASIEALTAFTGEQSQIHSRRGGERAYADTVFTVRLLRSVVVGGALAALAPVFAWFFGGLEQDGRYWLTGLFLLLAGNGLLDALQSPLRAVAMKELDFRRVAVGDCCAALLGATVTVALAWLRRDVWALVIGQLAATAARSLASYLVAPCRPRLRLESHALRELYGYTRGAVGTPFLLMMVFQAPAFVLAKLADTAAVAVYSYGEKLAKVPEDLCLRVLGPVAIPAYSKLADDPARLRNAWLRAVRAVLLVALPGTTALVWIGGDLPAIVFGGQFRGADGLFPLLAVHGGLAGVTSVIGPLFWAIGEPHRDRRAQALRCAVIYALGVPLTLRFGAGGFAAAATAAMLVCLCVSLRMALRRLGVAWREFWPLLRQAALVALALGTGLCACDLLGVPHGWLRVALGGSGAALALLRAVQIVGLFRARP
jgi:O-antigen/teichoic acid export membrane protein